MELRTKFQDEDFELGEVVTADIKTIPDGCIKLKAAAKKGGIHTILYDSLEELNEEWEDYEEEQYYWLIDCEGTIIKDSYYPSCPSEYELNLKQIGNFFTTKEEAKKAVEKLKALQRLRENGFRFDGWKRDEKYYGDFTITATDQTSCDDEDLDLLFGGEE